MTTAGFNLEDDRVSILQAAADGDEALARTLQNMVDEEDGRGDRALAVVKRLAFDDLPTAGKVAVAFEASGAGRQPVLIAARIARAHVLTYQNDFQSAQQLLHEAEEAAHAAHEQRLLADTRLAAVQVHARLGRLQEAEDKARGALEAYQGIGDHEMVANSRINLGIVRRMCGDCAEAVELFEQAAAHFRDDPQKHAVIASNRAEALLDMERFAEAEAAFREALAGFTALSSSHATAIVEGNLADLLSRQGRVDAALHHFEHARECLRLDGAEADAARLVSEEAEALLGAGACEDADALLRQAVPVLHHHGLERERARALAAQARALASLARGEEADGCARRAIELYEQWDDGVAVSLLRVLLVSMRRQPTPDPGSLDTILDALTTRPALHAIACADIAERLCADGDVERAAAVLDRVSGSPVLEILPIALRLGAVKAGLHLARDQPDQAIAELEAAVTACERMRGSLRSGRLRAAVSSSGQDSYLALCRLCVDRNGPGDVDRGFRALESLRARGVLEAMSLAPANGDDPDRREGELAGELAACDRRLQILYDRLGRQALGAETHEDIARLRDLEQERARVAERCLYRGTGRLPLFTAMGLDEAARLVPDDVAALSYFSDGETVGVFILHRGAGQVVARLCAAPALYDLASKLAFCRDRLLERTDNAAGIERWMHYTAEIHAAMIAPIEPRLQGARVVCYALPAALEWLPFAALHADGQLLLERFECRAMPGVSVALRLGQGDPGPDGGLVASIGFGDADTPLVTDEIERVASIYDGATGLVGAAATRSAVADVLAEASLLHIATHGVFSPDNPLSSRLELADGWLTARELASLVRPGSRVVLGACDVGREGSRGAEERLGFASALIGAGAAEVVAAKWRLHDRTARDLLVHLHEIRRAQAGRGRAMSLSAALRAACLEAASSGCSPVHWAALNVIGGI